MRSPNYNIVLCLRFLCGSRWVGIRLDMISNSIVTIVSLLLVILRGSIAPALAGVVITQAMQLTGMFQYGVRQLAEVENLMTSVERYAFPSISLLSVVSLCSGCSR